MYPQDKSAQIKASLRERFRDGTSKLADRRCFGYSRAQDGSLTINSEEAKTIQWIFESYLSGSSLGEIAGGLESSGLPSPTGKLKWNREAISKILSNEKYVGSVLLQKAVLFCGYQAKNDGETARFLMKNHHSAIITRELFEAVQNAKLQRSKHVRTRWK